MSKEDRKAQWLRRKFKEAKQNESAKQERQVRNERKFFKQQHSKLHRQNAKHKINGLDIDMLDEDYDEYDEYEDLYDDDQGRR